jgi:O-antigen/teichoic acid export membrane protein
LKPTESFLILRLLEKARHSQLVQSAAILATGTAAAQAIAVLASPVLTRLYPPEAFGLYATFIALVSSLTPAATGRYEVALMLPRADRSARELYAVALWFCVILCATLVLLTTAILGSDFAPEVLLKLGDWALVAPLTLFGVGIFNATTYAANRAGRYKDIARSSVVQASIIAGVNIALGFAGAPFSGLIVGNLVGVALSLLYLLYSQRDFLQGGSSTGLRRTSPYSLSSPFSPRRRQASSRS